MPKTNKRPSSKDPSKRTKKPATAHDGYTLPPGKVLAMRTCNADLTSHNGFQWPESGPVSAPDWSHAAVCGKGLHALLWGEGDGSLLDFSDAAKWLVIEVDPSACVDLGGKVKFQSANVVFVGNRNSAPEFIQRHGARGRSVVSGTATAGDSGTATAGYSGTATAGDSGTATAGDSGTARSGYAGIVVVRWWDNAEVRYRLTVGYVGEGGIDPNTFYRCDVAGKLVKA